ncbi:ABC transporter substrate-binding protein [Marinomonas arenicola]|uniref:ABC transporter substrate-binding protein n=1 Tax=Marinomonas arenicola TaxID=569601 RepID=UPI00311FEA5A
MKKKLFAALVGALCYVMNAVAAPQVIEDVLGRQVTVDVPAKRVVLGFYAEDYMAIGSEKAFDHVVGLSLDTWKGWRPASWSLYTQHRPSLKQIPDVGEVEAQTFSIEKVLSLNPSVVVLADWQFKGLGADVDVLESAGIPVVVVDYNAQTLARHVNSTLIIGTLTGEDARAQKMAKDYENSITYLQNTIAKVGLPKPRTYVEFGNKGPNEYSFTYGKNMWGAMISAAGGDNIAAPFVEWWGPINPEQVLASRPEVIFIAGTESSKQPDAMLIGQGIDRKESVERLTGFTTRSGWDSLPAVENKRVFGIYQGASRTIMDGSMMQYLAKALYPQLFADLKPEQNYLNFYKQYLPVVPQGTFAVQMTD